MARYKTGNGVEVLNSTGSIQLITRGSEAVALDFFRGRGLLDDPTAMATYQASRADEEHLVEHITMVTGAPSCKALFFPSTEPKLMIGESEKFFDWLIAQDKISSQGMRATLGSRYWRTREALSKCWGPNFSLSTFLARGQLVAPDLHTEVVNDYASNPNALITGTTYKLPMLNTNSPGGFSMIGASWQTGGTDFNYVSVGTSPAQLDVKWASSGTILIQPANLNAVNMHDHFFMWNQAANGVVPIWIPGVQVITIVQDENSVLHMAYQPIYGQESLARYSMAPIVGAIELPVYSLQRWPTRQNDVASTYYQGVNLVDPIFTSPWGGPSNPGDGFTLLEDLYWVGRPFGSDGGFCLTTVDDLLWQTNGLDIDLRGYVDLYFDVSFARLARVTAASVPYTTDANQKAQLQHTVTKLEASPASKMGGWWPSDSYPIPHDVFKTSRFWIDFTGHGLDVGAELVGQESIQSVITRMNGLISAVSFSGVQKLADISPDDPRSILLNDPYAYYVSYAERPAPGPIEEGELYSYLIRREADDTVVNETWVTMALIVNLWRITAIIKPDLDHYNTPELYAAANAQPVLDAVAIELGDIQVGSFEAGNPLYAVSQEAMNANGIPLLGRWMDPDVEARSLFVNKGFEPAALRNQIKLMVGLLGFNYDRDVSLEEDL